MSSEKRTKRDFAQARLNAHKQSLRETEAGLQHMPRGPERDCLTVMMPILKAEAGTMQAILDAITD